MSPTADTFILGANLGSAKSVLAFGNGGGDTFSVEALGNMLLVGGHGSENVDTNADGLADADLNTLSFASLNSTTLTASSTGSGWGSNGQKGLLARIGVASSGGLGADMAPMGPMCMAGQWTRSSWAAAGPTPCRQVDITDFKLTS